MTSTGNQDFGRVWNHGMQRTDIGRWPQLEKWREMPQASRGYDQEMLHVSLRSKTIQSTRIQNQDIVVFKLICKLACV